MENKTQERVDIQKQIESKLEKRIGIGTLIALGLGAGMMYIGGQHEGGELVRQHGYGMMWGASLAASGYAIGELIDYISNRMKKKETQK